MLKIKDNVDLKELEKFGILFDDLDWRQDWRCDDFKISKKKHHILALNGSGANRYDRLFDLIQAGLVEKVSDKQ